MYKLNIMSFNHFSETKLALLPNELQDYIYGFIMKDNITSLLKEMMHQSALELDFERAAMSRDKIHELERK